jgi:hypothetical protein
MLRIVSMPDTIRYPMQGLVDWVATSWEQVKRRNPAK